MGCQDFLRKSHGIDAGFAAAGLSGWSYTTFECAQAEFPDLVRGLGPEWAGLSVTMPIQEVEQRR